MSSAVGIVRRVGAERVGKSKAVSPRIIELRKKIHDSSYIENAVNRIAYILSKNLIDNPEELQLNLHY